MSCVLGIGFIVSPSFGLYLVATCILCLYFVRFFQALLVYLLCLPIRKGHFKRGYNIREIYELIFLLHIEWHPPVFTLNFSQVKWYIRSHKSFSLALC